MEVNETINLAKYLMSKHNLNDWKFEFSKKANNCGDCDFHNKKIRLSIYFYRANDEEQVRDTLLHEIAHALAWYRYRESDHGSGWKQICVEIGCRPIRLASNDVIIEKKIRTDKFGRPLSKTKYRGVCPNCHRESYSYKRSNVACRNCCDTYNYGKFSENFKIRWY